jgi:hypothetical protein
VDPNSGTSLIIGVQGDNGRGVKHGGTAGDGSPPSFEWGNGLSDMPPNLTGWE